MKMWRNTIARDFTICCSGSHTLNKETNMNLLGLIESQMIANRLPLVAVTLAAVPTTVSVTDTKL